MKSPFVRLPLVAAIVMLLASCAGFPKPEADTDTLVVGNFALDFPDAFFDLRARTLDSGIRLDFRNVTRNKDFTLITGRGGYFYFLANGGDDYVMDSYAYSVSTEHGTFSGSDRIQRRFMADQGVVQYLGHMFVSFGHPHRVRTSANTTRWTADVSSGTVQKRDEAQAWLKAQASDTPWLSKELRSSY